MPAPDLYPLPISTLVSRLDREIQSGDAIYTLRPRDWWVPPLDRDLSISHFGRRIGTPSGPASGPHTQLAQNFVLAWLTGGRFMEVKTIQVNDQLEIPRPCIHVPHVGYNVEWSQELRLLQSVREYVKGWMLLHMLASEHGPGLWPGVETVFDLSLGYDLAGVRSDTVRNAVALLRDSGDLIEEQRQELPGSLSKWAAVPVPETVCDTVTLSTFHGCPADEIEAIASETLDWGFHTIIKLNPTLLGYERACDVIARMGYQHITLDRADFDGDLQWDQLLEMLPRLEAKAKGMGLGFGVKLTNTLVCKSDETPFTDETMYLSGPPLHVISFTLADLLRSATHDSLPMTFSAGVEAANFADCVAAGLGPVTSCTDLLKARGYARQTGYLRRLERRMAKVNARTIDAFRQAEGEGATAAEGAQRFLAQRAASLLDDPYYHRANNEKPPKKVGTELELLDCLTCDKCIPVCPNVANFTFEVPRGEYAAGSVNWTGARFETSPSDPLVVSKRHQIGTHVDACNQCGHCDVWCPEDGGPYIVKPNVFSSSLSFSDHPERDGFLVSPNRLTLTWRSDGQVYGYTKTGENTGLFELAGGQLWLENDQPVSCEGRGDTDLRLPIIMRLVLTGLTASDAPVWLPPERI